MKKSIIKFICLAFVALTVFSLVSCDKSDSIKKAFEDEGYTVTSVSASDSVVMNLVKSTLTEDQIEKIDNYEVFSCVNGLNIAIIIKCPSSSDIKDFLTVEDEDGKKDTSLYDDAKKDGTINGNCVIFTLSSKAKEIFEKA